MVVRWVRRAVVAGVVLAVMPAVGPRPEAAGAGGGDWLYPARDRYEAGQTVTMIGYGFVMAGSQPDWRRTGYHAYLRQPGADPVDAAAGDDVAWPGLALGRVTVEEVEPHWGRNVRASIEFPLPEHLAPGVYAVDVCTAGCGARLGDFIESELHVGVDAASPVVRDWPLTEPAIRWLEDDAQLATDLGPVTAADVRAGRVPAPAPAPAASVPPRSTETAHRGGAGSSAAATASRGAGGADAVAPGDATEVADATGDDTTGGWLVAGGAVLALAAAGAPWLMAARAGRRRDRGPGAADQAVSWDDDAPPPPTESDDAGDPTGHRVRL